eukprot:298564_1
MARGLDDHKPIVSIIASSITIVLQITFIISLLKGFYWPKRAHTPNILHYAAWGVFSALALAFIAWIVEELMYRLHVNPHIWIIAYIIFFLFIFITYLLFYALMVVRLFLTFENTDMALSERSWKIHIAVIILFIFLGIAALIMRFTGADDHIVVIVSVAVIALAGFNLVYLVYTFNYKLFDITLSLRLSVANFDNNGDMVLTENQMVFLRTIRKHSLLGTIKVCTVLLDILIVIIFVETRSYVFWMIGWCISFNIASLCVYLGFSVNKSTYDMLCFRCDASCGRLCNQLTKRSYLRRNANSHDSKRRVVSSDDSEATHTI